MWRRLDKSVRNQVRKAERSGLTVDASAAPRSCPRSTTSSPRGCAISDRRSTRTTSFVRSSSCSARARASSSRARTARTVGGLVALAFKDRLVVPWAACLKEYFAFCPNMLLYWETLRHACVDGFRRFDFGRSTRDSGTYRFKRQWGAEEEPLFWYGIPGPRGNVAPRPARIGAPISPSESGSVCRSRSPDMSALAFAEYLIQ